ncbi:30S ribosomal protein S8 [Porphyridium purpureum]|uniref:30S ribosomal protein S8 n=1 Tax=Porphyridium purpureum TaxID=35688 RepID=A0A5J4YHV6_PORPP|nr:30S ribosomal protein S8 [Porphyridium purpureum]|eukprot:POR6404..scf297_16
MSRRVPDRVSDVFNRIRHATQLKRHSVRMPRTTLTVDVLRVLLNEGYVSGVRVLGEPPRQECEVFLKYNDMDQSVIRTIRRISKPSRRIIVSARQLIPSRGGLGRFILSTNLGVISDAEARKLNVGGEVLGEVF